MGRITSGTTYRCTNDKCRAQIQAKNDCGCDDDCAPVCCGSKMEKL